MPPGPPGSGSDDVPIRLDLDRRLEPVTTDAERLRVALVNILTNARHAVAARAGARDAPMPIRLRTRRVGANRVAIEVTDQGTGIAAEDLTRVFDPYFTTRRTGTGLGLAISRNIIEGLGGTICHVEPRGRRQRSADRASETRANSESWRPGISILLVDDETKILNALAQALRAEGHEVVATANPREAQRLLSQRMFDLLVIDNLMPELTGLDLIRDLHASNTARNGRRS